MNVNNAALSNSLPAELIRTQRRVSRKAHRTSNSPREHRPTCTPKELKARIRALRNRVDFYSTHVNGHLAIECITETIQRLEKELADA